MTLKTTVTARYTFESAHWLPGVPDTHKCHRIHGHNYEMEIEVEGEVGRITGFVIDFGELDKVVAPLVAQIDHRTLNDIPGLQNPTAELIAEWFFKRIAGSFVEVNRVTIWETPRYYASVVLTETFKKAIDLAKVVGATAA